MIKKVSMIIVLLIAISGVCFAETSSIICEDNSADSVTYTVCETTASPFGRLGKAFSKHIDTAGNTHYWIRLALGGENYMYYQMKLIIDGAEYTLQEEKEPFKYQVASTSRMIMFCNRPGARNYYQVPQEVVEKIKTAQKITMIYRTQQSKDEEKSWNSSMIRKSQEIINADYKSNSKYHHG